MHYTVLYSIVSCCIVWHCIVSYVLYTYNCVALSIILCYCIASYCIILYSIVYIGLYFHALYRIVSCCIPWHWIVLPCYINFLCTSYGRASTRGVHAWPRSLQPHPFRPPAPPHTHAHDQPWPKRTRISVEMHLIRIRRGGERKGTERWHLISNRSPWIVPISGTDVPPSDRTSNPGCSHL